MKEQSFSNPREATISNYNITAATYEADAFEYPEVLRQILESFPASPHTLVVGCGPADDAAALATMGFAVIGIDNSPGMIAEARTRNPHIPVQEMDMKHAAQHFPEEEFDVIFAQYSLFHELKANLPSTIQGLAQLLKPGGFFYATTQESLTGVPQESSSQRSDDSGRVYVNAETLESLTDIFTQAGISLFFAGTRKPEPQEHQFFKLTIAGTKY